MANIGAFSPVKELCMLSTAEKTNICLSECQYDDNIVELNMKKPITTVSLKH